MTPWRRWPTGPGYWGLRYPDGSLGPMLLFWASPDEPHDLNVRVPPALRDLAAPMLAVLLKRCRFRRIDTPEGVAAA